MATLVRTTITLQRVPPTTSRLDPHRPVIAFVIERELLQQVGIAKAVVNLSTEMVYIEFDSAHWNQASLAGAAASAEARAYAVLDALQRS